MNALTSRPYSRAWVLPASRSFAALLPGLGVVFVQDHSMPVGFVTGAVFFLGTAIALIALAGRAEDARARFRLLGFVHALAGVASFVLLFAFPEPLAFLSLVAIWAVGAAAIEFSATRITAAEEGTVSRVGRDWRTLAIGTVFFGLLIALSPLIGIADPVSLTGLFGAYAAIVGVYHAIAAASLAFGARVTGEQASRGLESES